MTSRSHTFASAFEKARSNQSKKKRKRPVVSSESAPQSNTTGTTTSSPNEDQNQQVNLHKNEDSNKKKKKQRPPKKPKHARNESSFATTNAADTADQQNQQRPTKKPRLSRQALDLSAQLKECSQHKQLDQALKLYWNADKKKIRDQFHACITLDCCARCGAFQEMEKILHSLLPAPFKGNYNYSDLSVETMTSVIKGYALAGNMSKASQIFNSMLSDGTTSTTGKNKNKKNKSKNINDKTQPNVRTFNTLLRGCLWTAASIDQKDDNIEGGGVVTSETMWKKYHEYMTSLLKDHQPTLIFDVSSYEYSISLLCQDLQLDQAEQRLQECIQQFPDAHETIAASQASLAQAKALLGDKNGAIQAIRLARQAIQEGTANQQQQQQSSTTSSKQSWKGCSQSRTDSNALFRKHRLSEIELQLQAMEETCQAKQFPPDKNILAKRLVDGLFYFSGGGITQQANASDDGEAAKPQPNQDSPKGVGRLIRRQLVNASFLSFGLKAALKRADDTGKQPTDFVRVKESERIFRTFGSHQAVIQDDGTMDFRGKSKKGEEQPTIIDVELGSGHGDWIVHQAHAFPDRFHVAVEMRADRVHQIFSKGMLVPSGPLSNLAVVGDDSKNFLERLRPKSVSNLFVNHPEPPTQVHGKSNNDLQTIMAGGPEPAHMLHSDTLIAAGECLKDDASSSSRIVIVTDNLFYGRLICATVVRINRQQKREFGFQSVHPEGGYRVVETLDTSVRLLEGQPSSQIGHAVVRSSKGKGSSYFDRLWRTGAGAHASRSERYILVLEKKQN